MARRGRILGRLADVIPKVLFTLLTNRMKIIRKKSLLWKKSRKSLKIIATVTVNIRRIKAVICFVLWFLRDFSFWRDCLLISRIVGTLSESLRSWIKRWSLVLFSSILVVGIECEILAWKVVLWLHFMFLPPTESVFKQSVFWLYSK